MTVLESPLADQGFAMTAPGIAVREWSVGANVTCLDLAEDRIVAGLGDGRVVGVTGEGVQEIARHSGAVSGLCGASGVIYSAGQDGKLSLAKPGAAPETLFQARDDWATALARHGSRVAVAAGRSVMVYDDGALLARFDDHPSTVSGLAFFPQGRRLAVSRYNGITLWMLDDLAKPVELTWAGSMTSVSISPDGRYVAGATQDREIHVWDLVTGRDFRLGGYQRKVKGIGWTRDTQYLYTTGADVLVAWGLAGDPGAIPPVEIGYSFSQTVSAVTAQAPADRLAAGYTNGCILVGEVRKGTAKIARQPDGAVITALQAGGTGERLVFGTNAGMVGALQT